MKSRVWIPVAALLMLLIAIVYFFFYQSCILNKRAVSSVESSLYVFHVGRRLVRDFAVPINDEGFFDVRGLHRIPYQVNRWERLRTVLDRVIDATGENITYEVIHGQLCVLPVKTHPDEILSPLDLRVTVDLGRMSAWEAIKEVTFALNQQKDVLDKPVIAEPEEFVRQKVTAPLFTAPQDFNLSLHDVTAREALCAIFAASESDIDYRYSGHTSRRRNYHTLIIASHPARFIQSLRDRSGRFYREEACWWLREINEQVGDWDVAPPYDHLCTDMPEGRDIHVSLKLEHASLWEAMEAIVRAVNRQEAMPHALFLYPPGWRANKQPPPELITMREITLDIDNLSVVWAIREVLEASSLRHSGWEVRIGKDNSYDIHLYCCNEIMREAAPFTPRQRDRWKRKIGYHGIRRIPPGREDMLLESTDAYVAHLGLHISVDLEDVSVWEAFQQIVAAANKLKGDIQPLGVLPEELRYNESPVPELTDLREITLSMQDVTVQEALDAVTAASSLDVSYWYEWQEDAARVLIIPPEKGRHREEADPLTPEERAWWLKERGLRQTAEDPPVWTWTPPGMGTTLEHYSNGQLIPIPNAARNDE